MARVPNKVMIALEFAALDDVNAVTRATIAFLLIPCEVACGDA